MTVERQTKPQRSVVLFRVVSAVAKNPLVSVEVGFYSTSVLVCSSVEKLRRRIELSLAGVRTPRTVEEFPEGGVIILMDNLNSIEHTENTLIRQFSAPIIYR
ncbi:hypothetical protein CEXT_18351 [Caerostris extrusa]|uniref:Uncharacterized protein n=1 Tax=Caerostris extrusa TaxID=172846 RepID=A0AAV4Y5R5_CAEEX|nr:hypothetical protein CEXT_18351 [Caerostris extrusa]